eukprot:SAG22_NODE_166_length_16765_cov_30.782791_14_plen_41_part_00
MVKLGVYELDWVYERHSLQCPAGKKGGDSVVWRSSAAANE